MNDLNISIDTYDFVLITAMIGGFWTGIWLPFTLFLVWELMKQWIEIKTLSEDKKTV